MWFCMVALEEVGLSSLFKGRLASVLKEVSSVLREVASVLKEGSTSAPGKQVQAGQAGEGKRKEGRRKRGKRGEKVPELRYLSKGRSEFDKNDIFKTIKYNVI